MDGVVLSPPPVPSCLDNAREIVEAITKGTEAAH
jgi:hypothetical protein